MRGARSWSVVGCGMASSFDEAGGGMFVCVSTIQMSSRVEFVPLEISGLFLCGLFDL